MENSNDSRCIKDEKYLEHKLIKPFLTRQVYSVIEAVSGTKALACARKNHPDVIVSDLKISTSCHVVFKTYPPHYIMRFREDRVYKGNKRTKIQ